MLSLLLWPPVLAPAVDGGKNNNNPGDGKASNEAHDNKGIEVSALNNVNVDAAQDLLNQLNVLLSGLLKRDVAETEDGILGKREELTVGDLLTQVQGLVSQLTDALGSLLQGADNLPLVGDLLKQVQGLLDGLTGGWLVKRQDLPAGELLTQVPEMFSMYSFDDYFGNCDGLCLIFEEDYVWTLKV